MNKAAISRLMAGWGRKGGKIGGPKGGRTRMALLTVQERKELARKAAQARWKKQKPKPKPKPKRARQRSPALKRG